MSEFKQPNILWLSDIHFGAYEKWVDSAIRPEKIITNYFSTLIAKINEVNYTHLLIGGDLAMSGSADDYKDLFDKFLSKIKDNNPHLRIITVIGNHDIDQSKLKDNGDKYFELLDSKEKFKTINDQFEKNTNFKFNKTNANTLLELSEGYRNFVKKYILPTLKSNNIELFGYEESEGLVGIIYDKEYNLIFNCLNTSWYAFGKNNIISLVEKYKSVKDKDLIFLELMKYTSNKFEFGNLEVGSAVQINDKIKEYKDHGIFDESCIITMMHHPLSWLSYDIQYLEENRPFQALLENSDIVLTGHQHVPYSKPTSYKGKTYFFEASQLFDYHFYLDTAYRDFNLGYYTFSVSHELEVFTSSYSKMNYVIYDSLTEISDQLFIREAITSKFKFLTEGTERFKSRKSVFGCFKDFDVCKNYFDKRIIIFKGIGAIQEKQAGINFCLEKSFSVIFSKLNSGKEVDKVDGLYLMKLENKLLLLQQQMKIKPEDFINQIFGSLNTNLLCKDEGISLIQILIPDFWLLAFFDEEFHNTKVPTYKDAFELIDDTFTIIRTKLFSPENLKSNDHLYNKELSFEIINLEKYRNA